MTAGNPIHSRTGRPLVPAQGTVAVQCWRCYPPDLADDGGPALPATAQTGPVTDLEWMTPSEKLAEALQ